jgi:integrase
VLLLTGLRIGEVAKLQRGWADLEQRQITLPASSTKTGQTYSILLSKPCADLLASAMGRSAPRNLNLGRVDEVDSQIS